MGEEQAVLNQEGGSTPPGTSTDTKEGKKRHLLEYDPTKEKQYISGIIDRIRTIQRNRAGFEKQWLVNTAFLYGRHHFDVGVMPRQGDLSDRIVWEMRNIQRTKRDKLRRTVNYTMPLWRSLLARMIQLKSRISVTPETQDDRDIAAARVGQEVLEDFWFRANKSNPVVCQDLGGMLKVLLRLFNYLTVCGRGWLMPYFNPQSLDRVNLNDEIINGPVGAVEVKPYSPFDVFMSPSRYWVATQDVMSVEQIADLYNVEVEAEDIGLTNTDRQLQRLLNGQNMEESKFEDSAIVLTFFHLPTKKYPQGQFSIFTSKKMFLKPVALPEEYEGTLPLFKFGYLDIMGGDYPQGMVEQLIPLQEDYNYTAERLAGYKKWLAGKLLMPIGCRPETSWNDEIGQIVKYDATGGKPEYMAGGSPPVFIIREFDRIRRDMEDIAATHDTSMSRVPSGIKSGIGIENLTESDKSQIAPQLIDTEQQLSFFAHRVLKIMEKRYTEPRLVGITGKNLAVDVRIFKGENLQGEKRVEISLGSNLPSNKEARAARIIDLADRGWIGKEKGLELLEFGDVEGIFHDIDKQQERVEIMEMSKGVDVIPAEWENHTVRIAELTDFLKSSDYRKLSPEIQNLFIGHLRMHRIYLSNEMQQMNQMTAQPGAGAPGPSAPVKKGEK